MSFVLIESDWNLKEHRGSGKDKEVLRINRIRLEFKVHPVNVSDSSAVKVLIESDWNLKFLPEPQSVASDCSINRIRLEFKGYIFRCRWRSFWY